MLTRERSNKPTMLDAENLKKKLDYLDNFELREPVILIYQPPPMVITLEPGMGYHELSEEFKQKIYETSRNGISLMLSQCDDEIRRRRKRGVFHNEHLETKEVASWCGEVKYRRRAYLDQEGNNRYLCDELLDLDKGQRVSLNILLRALTYAGIMSYGKVKELIECWTGLKRSPETYRRWVLRIGEYIKSQRKKKCAQIFENPSYHSEDYGKNPDFLFLEADGCHIYMRIPPSLEEEIQKETARGRRRKSQKASSKKEVRLGLWYEGKRPRRGTEGNGKFEVTGKTYFGGMMDVEEFWETAAMTGLERYGLGPLTRIFGGGDGANWIGPHFENFQGSLFMLCRYHWKRDIFRVFPEESGMELVVYVESNNKDLVNDFIDKKLKECTKENSKKKILDLKKYLLNQWDFIQNYRVFTEQLNELDPSLSRMGVIEGHIYQVLYLRFESRGGYWSSDGLDALLHVLMAGLNGNLAQLIRASGWEARDKDLILLQKKQILNNLSVKETPFVHGTFPVLKRPVRPFNDFLKRIAHPEREKAA